MLIPNLIITFLFNYFKHPLSMTIIIVCQTLIMSMCLSLLTKTFWMSYILFLVFLGGMLILFLYITSLAPNEKFSPLTLPLTMMMLITLLTYMMVIVSMMDQTYWNIFNSNTDTNQLSNSHNLIPSMNQISMLMKLYNTPSWMLTMMLILYLLLTLIAIVKITSMNMGPLRLNMHN
uniref:NADH-ubiquinone oxidoreductase chain 6 n=1 Tax=Phyllomimus sinicus TaxID=948398 RepID=A0A1Q1MPY8_9ORTH|nr:NADH dehydrogenase subunit 6 [Phyllomimus sinicus]AQM40145.1 NADH dehydrogenase subunit 6 [Phyllomimus sinicus]